MSQRLSGYKRKDGDCYETPAWVTQALLPHLGQARQVWELVLTRRIVWFDGRNAAPSFNHSWYVWDWKHSGPPVLAYGPNF